MQICREMRAGNLSGERRQDGHTLAELRDSMARLKLSVLTDYRTVEITAKRPAAVHGALVASAEVFYEARVLRRRASSAASASSHFRKIAIFGILDVTFGQTIQYVLDNFKEISIGLTSRPLMMSQAASAVRASATPWPSMAASISMLALPRTVPCTTGSATPAVSNHLAQVLQSSRRKSGSFNRSDGAVMWLRFETSLGLQTGKSSSEQRRTASSPGHLPSP